MAASRTTNNSLPGSCLPLSSSTWRGASSRRCNQRRPARVNRSGKSLMGSTLSSPCSPWADTTLPTTSRSSGAGVAISLLLV